MLQSDTPRLTIERKQDHSTGTRLDERQPLPSYQPFQ